MNKIVISIEKSIPNPLERTTSIALENTRGRVINLKDELFLPFIRAQSNLAVQLTPPQHTLYVYFPADTIDMRQLELELDERLKKQGVEYKKSNNAILCAIKKPEDIEKIFLLAWWEEDVVFLIDKRPLQGIPIPIRKRNFWGSVTPDQWYVDSIEQFYAIIYMSTYQPINMVLSCYLSPAQILEKALPICQREKLI